MNGIVKSLRDKRVQNKLPHSGRKYCESSDDEEDDPFDQVLGSNQAIKRAEQFLASEPNEDSYLRLKSLDFQQAN
jgi:hypothetical protein